MKSNLEVVSLESFAKPYLPKNLLAEVEALRLSFGAQGVLNHREGMAQFFTPAPVAELMADLFENLDGPEISLLDAGAGIGTLLAAVVARICQCPTSLQTLKIVAYEIDRQLLEALERTLAQCQEACALRGITFTYEIRHRDFIEDAVAILAPGLFDRPRLASFTHAILNPPYGKIGSSSKTRQLLQRIGLETTNIYTGFMALTALLLEPEGEMISITPRSFCNGTYFRPFRKLFLDLMSLSQIHAFESRNGVFRDDAILQETIILHAQKQYSQKETVTIITSQEADDDLELWHHLPYCEVVRPNDLEKFIRILPDADSQWISQQIGKFNCSLEDLGISVSTGRVVDFRAREFLRTQPSRETIPLIYPVNLADGHIEYPVLGKKPQAILNTPATQKLLVPDGNYVLCKRFSSKEEKRRIVAAIYQAGVLGHSQVGFENHINYFHQNGRGLDKVLARGLSVFLNSTLVDRFFRLFNGHTQVNVTDLRSLTYPSKEDLIVLGQKLGSRNLTQQEIDILIEKELLTMPENSHENPANAKFRIDEALDILGQLGLPKKQLNERSALTLLALLEIRPSSTWKDAKSRHIGITPMMDFMAEHYGKTYKPNTRETVRRQTVHQFLDASLILMNPDNPQRPVNSPKTVYQIEENALKLIRKYGTTQWMQTLRVYLNSVETLRQKYAQEREMARIPVVIEGQERTLSPGGQNVLVKKIIEEFAPRFTPGGRLIYVGDTDEKFVYFAEDALADLGVTVDARGKMPDAIVYFSQKNWLVLIEAVTSHGPINPKRKQELERLFGRAVVPLVMVTAFLNRRAMVEYLPEIAWETDVWVAEDTTHLIHFDGQHLLQLYTNVQ
ncbi:MAG: BsuBI/PstI family type II restriction endonuclease [Cyanobacteriota bacterium]|nr:BsuBI/PstI family type II restriction endonuclease [Cyanobacteriota bacterium]